MTEHHLYFNVVLLSKGREGVEVHKFKRVVLLFEIKELLCSGDDVPFFLGIKVICGILEINGR